MRTAAPAGTTAVDDPVWHRALGALIESLERPNFWTALVRCLSDAVQFDSWVVLTFRRDGKPEVHAECPGPEDREDELFRDYVNGFYLLDPFYLDCLDDPRAGLKRLDDVAPDNFEAEDYYQRYFRLNIVKDEVQFNLPLSGGRVLILSLGAQHRYGAAEMRTLVTVSPWVLALMRQRARWVEELAPAQTREDSAADGERLLPLEVRAADLPLGLTARELDVVHLLLSGCSSKGIALKLGISPETVKAHRRHIYTKLGVKSHPELFAILLRERALPAPRTPVSA